jgi:peptidoglycan hydrolase-like protein with peptidoglycan-binding domain
LVSAALMAVLAVAGCASSGGKSSSADRAQANVTAAQRAVTEAQATFDAKKTAFCSSTQTYVTALDHYGNLLTESPATVGDVRTAGKDLAAPRQAATKSAEEATAAHEALGEAQQRLADAQHALAAAQAGGSGQPSTTATATTTTTLAPPVPAATVDRVKQAEKDLTTAQAGITDQTPLVQASQSFNAAAVSLELAWLRLFADAGCLTSEQQAKAEKTVHDLTVQIQTALTQAGYYSGPIDGVYGPTTVDAVKALQKANNLPVTGYVDQATEAALKSSLGQKGGQVALQATASTAAVQQTLKLAGFWTGPVDGNWTPALTDALKKFQTELGVPATGAVDAATIAAFESELSKGRSSASSPSPSTSTPPTTVGSSTTSLAPTTTASGN